MGNLVEDLELGLDSTDVHTDEDIEYQVADPVEVPISVSTDLSMESHRVVGVARTHGLLTVRIGTLGPSDRIGGEVITS